MRKSSAQALPSLSVRIDLDAEIRIGPGKIQLLAALHTEIGRAKRGASR
jgi:molybdate transport system regulatory protein